LLLSRDDDLPEGWGKDHDDDADDVDMEITFTPGLSTAKEDRDETTLEKYQRKMKEKKKKRKEELKEKVVMEPENKISSKDDFFAQGSEEEDTEAGASSDEDVRGKRVKHKKRGAKNDDDDKSMARHVSTAEELALLTASDNPTDQPKHFNMKAVLKAEKKQRLKRKKGKKTAEMEENEVQEDFSINVKDDRFQAVHDDHAFAIDPSNPRFKKTKNMSALLEERAKRQRQKYSDADGPAPIKPQDSGAHDSLKSLVESVKRKSAVMEQSGTGKRRKL